MSHISLRIKMQTTIFNIRIINHVTNRINLYYVQVLDMSLQYIRAFECSLIPSIVLVQTYNNIRLTYLSAL